MALIELICQFTNYMDEFVWWLYSDRSSLIRSEPIFLSFSLSLSLTSASISLFLKFLSLFLFTAVHPVHRLQVDWNSDERKNHELVDTLYKCRDFTRFIVCVRALKAHCSREAYVTAWLGAQIQRAQLVHRIERRIVLIPLLHRGDMVVDSSKRHDKTKYIFVFSDCFLNNI